MTRAFRNAATMVLATGLLMTVVAAKADQKFGKGVTIAKVTPIGDLYAHPESFLGKAIRIDGVVTAVCDEMGCWMALAAKDHPEQSVRFKVDHGKGIVFPLSARGKSASAEGVLEKVAASDTEAKEAAAQQAGKDAHALEFNQQYQVKATGAVVR
jgi:hypothetical protein